MMIGFEMEDHPDQPDFWHYVPSRIYPCWVCGEPTEWIYLDIGYQHPDCEEYPTEDEGMVKIIHGVKQPTAPPRKVKKGNRGSRRIVELPEGPQVDRPDHRE